MDNGQNLQLHPHRQVIVHEVLATPRPSVSGRHCRAGERGRAQRADEDVSNPCQALKSRINSRLKLSMAAL
jgi:hypothetical protein